jgi:NitT/TauT family transport system substrate-binding protein
MRVNPAIAVRSAVRSAARSLLVLLTGLAFFACFGAAESLAADPVQQPTPIQFSFDRPIDASDAPLVLAAADSLFSSEGLAVTTHIAHGSPDAIAGVAAGTSDLALVDINALIRFHDRSAAPPVKAVFVLFNKAPYAVVARKSRGIHALSDIEGKTLGVAEGDLSIRLWPALARQNESRSQPSRRSTSVPRCVSRCCPQVRSMR